MKFEDLPPMEESCSVCQGSGNIDHSYQTVVGRGKQKRKKTIKTKKTCENCRGHGKILTSFGTALMNLMENRRPWSNDLESVRDEIPYVYDPQCD